jgi:amino-acid N-acetyltransferase
MPVPEPATPADLEPALELLRRADLPVEGVAEGIADYFVVRAGGRVVGLAGLERHGNDGLLRSVAVDPACRGRGLAAALVATACERARALGLRAVYLLTATAHAYFRRRGFADCPREDAPAAIRESWEFHQGCPSSSAFMKKDLGA